jgi:hypothetical protein
MTYPGHTGPERSPTAREQPEQGACLHWGPSCRGHRLDVDVVFDGEVMEVGHVKQLYLVARGDRKKNPRKRRTSAPARKKKYARAFSFFFFSAFLGVSRQGEFENTRKKLSTFQKKSPGKCFFGGDFFSG